MRRAILILLAACGDPTPQAPPAPRDAAVAARPDAAPAPDPGFVGVITAGKSVDIAPQYPGVIADVLVVTGETVEQDQVVVKMDTTAAREEVTAASAALRRAEDERDVARVDVEEARRKLDLARSGVAAGTTPAQEVAAAELALKRAQTAQQSATSAIAELRARLQAARNRLTETALRVPFAGTVALRLLDPGSTVSAGAPILTVVGKGSLILRFAVPPGKARPITTGAAVVAEVETVSATVPAVVRQVNPTLDPASGMIFVEAELTPTPEIAPELRPGLAARVRAATP
jgi:RND family efflux transporter MFP subunit